MKSVFVILAAIYVFLCEGCVVIPTLEHYSHGFDTRGSIDENILQFIRADTTTKEEILLKLGEPEFTWQDERKFLYHWTMVRGYIAWAIGGGYTGSVGIHQIPRDYLLLVEFDENNIIKRYEIKSGGLFSSFSPDEVRDW